MLKRFVWTMLLIPLLLVAGCGTNTDNIKATELGTEVSLATGQSVSINGENLTIKFIAVTEDSRCPTGAQCVWAGRVICKVLITDSAGSSEVLLTQMGGISDYVKQDVGKYRISFTVNPYPEVGKTIADNDYRLRLTVNP